MSQCFAEVVRILSVEPHPNADKLDVAKILGTTVVVAKGSFQAGQLVVYFPPNLLIPDLQALKLGVQKYLKHSTYPGDVFKTQCRVGACKLRGVVSYGFIIPFTEIWGHADDYPTEGADVSVVVQAVKYEPPPPRQQGYGIPGGYSAPEFPQFHRYHGPENLYRYPNVLVEGEPVRITEKIHGTNSRVGVINTGGDGELYSAWQFMAGSNHVNRKRPLEGQQCAYWDVFDVPGIMGLLNDLCDEKHNVVIFGEIFGAGVQDMDYGVPVGERSYRVFDIAVDGVYLDWANLLGYCTDYGVPTVPLLYSGPYSREKVDELTYGPTTVGTPQAKFKGREGVVITPLVEREAYHFGRVILKSVSADYLDRKGAKDDGDLGIEAKKAA